MSEPRTSSKAAAADHELEDQLEHRFVEVPARVKNASTKLRLHYVRTRPFPECFAGTDPRAAPLTVLLHGFPDFWYSWRHQLAFLAARGLPAVALDVRGYARSDKPLGVEHYAPDVLAEDVRRVIEANGADRAIIVGHDLGGMLAYVFAMEHPSMVEALMVLNCPHPGHLLRMLASPRQLARSWYVFFFQLPGLPRWYLGAGRLWALRETYRRYLATPMNETEIQRYVDALGGASTQACLDHYRALLRWWVSFAQRPPAPSPIVTQVLWGKNDPFLGAEFALPPAAWLPSARVTLVDAGHWPHLDRPDFVNAELERLVRSVRDGLQSGP